jgi:predicted ribosome quality control (RQC) complex YloA/Tae2 family protein
MGRKIVFKNHGETVPFFRDFANPAYHSKPMSKLGSPSIVFPLLSFRELVRYVDYGRSLEGYRVERVFIPETKAHPDQYFKKEWALELYSPNGLAQLYFSVRSQQTALIFLESKTLKPAKLATRSGFDLTLAKKIEGQRIERINTLPNERIVKIRFSNSLELLLVFIPSQPEAVLFENGVVIASTKTRQEEDAPFSLPKMREMTAEQVKKIPFREEWLASAKTYSELWFNLHDQAALALRRQRIESVIKTQHQSFEHKRKSLTLQLNQSLAEPDWDRFGSLLQTHFYAKPSHRDGFYELLDYEKDLIVRVPADPKLGLKQQLERYFHQAKRNRTRLIETEIRIRSLSEKIEVAERNLSAVQNASTVSELISIEARMGLGTTDTKASSKEQKKIAQFSGKQYVSKEGLNILVGKNLTENLELTFKIAKGNDIWLHVKGRPGSHTVILLPQKRTASLDTLLDAAQLCILASGGRDWGKTEVDYTFRKHVKKIKNQTEVIYTHNKTLSIDLDEERLKRLYENE